MPPIAVEHLSDFTPHPAGSRGTGLDRGQVAHFEWNLRTDDWQWQSSVFDVYGLSGKKAFPGNADCFSLKHPDDVKTRRDVLQVLESGKMRSYVHRVFREDGLVRVVHSSARVTVDSRYRPEVMDGTVQALSDWEHPLGGFDLAHASDGVLMLCFRAQLPEAFAEAYVRHSGSIQRVVRQLEYPGVHADDVVQDVFEKLCHKKGGFDARRGSLAAYLTMQARSKCVDHVRMLAARRHREVLYHRDAPAEILEDAVPALTAGGVHKALADLVDDERVPIELAYLRGLSYRAVADHLGLPEGTVKTRIRRGLRKLRESSDLTALMAN